MKRKFSFHRALFFSFFCAFCFVSWPVLSQEVDNEREFDYDEDGMKGPAGWGDLKQEWHNCKNGSMQSPIDLLNKRVRIVPHFRDLKIYYKPSNATLKNRGHDIMLKWDDGAGHIEVNGTQYFLKQCHWHSPSEHTINGRIFALEAHLVHQSLSGGVAVIGIVYDTGKPDYFLSTIKEHLEEISDTNKEKVLNVIDPSLLKMQRGLYYRYMGSLTIPPCTQNVIWTIVRKVWTVAPKQVELLRVAVHDDSNTNARPLQPLNNREIKLQFKSREEDN